MEENTATKNPTTTNEQTRTAENVLSSKDNPQVTENQTTSSDNNKSQPSTVRPLENESTNPPEPQSQPSNKHKKLIIVMMIITLLIAAGVGVYFYFQNQDAKRETTNNSTTTPTTTSESPTPTPNPTIGWESYFTKYHGVTFKYPSNYTVSGELAQNLDNWTAGKGVTITNNNAETKPGIFVEAVYDGYGPYFPTGTLEVNVIDNHLQVGNITKVSEEEYQEMISNGYINDGSVLYTTKVFEVNNTPFSIRVSYTNREDTQIEEELMQILSTFKFIEQFDSTTKKTFLKNYNGFDYYLEWESVENPEKDEEYDFNLYSKVSLAEYSSEKKVSTYDIDYKLGFEDGNSHFYVIPIEDSTSEVFFLQPCNGAGCIYTEIVDLEEKMLITGGIVPDTDSSYCGSANTIYNKNLVCKKDETGKENLYYYERNSGTVNVISSVSGDETFNCKPDSYGLTYTFSGEDNENLEITICDKDQNDVRTIDLQV